MECSQQEWNAVNRNDYTLIQNRSLPTDLRGRKKYRSDSSVNSLSSRSGYLFGQSPLDDPTFAPPPKLRSDMEFLVTQEGKATSTLPSYDKVKHSGNIMARISLKSLFLKKWKQLFWIAYGDHDIYFFRSNSDFYEWAKNPNLTDNKRESLVKFNIDVKHDVLKPGVRCYRTKSLYKKRYGRSGLMHTFKLDLWMYYGPIIAGAFASKNRTETRCLLIIMKEMIKRERKGLTDFISDAESIHYERGSELASCSSFSTRSAPNYHSPQVY